MNAKTVAKARFKTKKEHLRARTARLELGAKKCQSQMSRHAPIAQQERTQLLRVRRTETPVQVVHQESLVQKTARKVCSHATHVVKILFLRQEVLIAELAQMDGPHSRVVGHAPHVRLVLPQ